jgi:hypothetical protein
LAVGVNADITEEADGGLLLRWNAGWRPELRYCRLKGLLRYRLRASLDDAALRSDVESLAAEAAQTARRLFTRCLAVIVEAVEQPAIHVDLGSSQIPARGFVTPLVLSLADGTADAAAIGTPGFGFHPYRQQIFDTLVGGPIREHPAN